MPDTTTPELTDEASPVGEVWDGELFDDEETDKPDPESDEAPEPKPGEPEAEQPTAKAGEEEPNSVDPKVGDPTKDPEAAKTDEEAEADRRRHNDEMAKARIQERESLSALAKQHIDNAAKAVEDAGDDETKREIAQIKVREAERDAADFLRDVEANQSIMQNDQSRIAREVSIFNPESNDFNAKAYDLALSHLAPHLITQTVKGADGKDTVAIIATQVSVYDFLKNEADNYQQMIDGVRSAAEAKGQRAEQEMRANADMPGARAPRSESADDKEARQMQEAFKGA